MATLYVTEFGLQGRDNNNNLVPIAMMPALAAQTVAVGAASAASAAFQANTGMVRLISDVTCSVAFAASPTATTSNMRLAADSPEYFSVPVGSSLKVAVIQNT